MGESETQYSSTPSLQYSNLFIYSRKVRYGKYQSDLFPQRRVTPLPGGYMGKILRVDMTTRRADRREFTRRAGSAPIHRRPSAGAVYSHA